MSRANETRVSNWIGWIGWIIRGGMDRGKYAVCLPDPGKPGVMGCKNGPIAVLPANRLSRSTALTFAFMLPQHTLEAAP